MNTIYKSGIDDSSHLSHAWIYDIDEDKMGNLWISTFSGLNKYDRKTSTFTSLFIDNNIKVSSSKNFFLSTQIDSEGKIWSIVADKGLYSFDPDQKIFEDFKFPAKTPGNPTNQSISSFFIDDSGEIWLTSTLEQESIGVYRYNQQDKKITAYLSDPNNSESLSSSILTKIIKDRRGNIWVGLKDGLNKLNPNTGKVTHFLSGNSDNLGIKIGRVEVLKEDNEGKIWIGTMENGLVRLV